MTKDELAEYLQEQVEKLKPLVKIIIKDFKEWYQMTDREKQREKKRIEEEINELQNDNFYRIVLKDDKKRFDENIGKIIKLKDELKELDLWQ